MEGGVVYSLFFFLGCVSAWRLSGPFAEICQVEIQDLITNELENTIFLGGGLHSRMMLSGPASSCAALPQVPATSAVSLRLTHATVSGLGAISRGFSSFRGRLGGKPTPCTWGPDAAVKGFTGNPSARLRVPKLLSVG